MVEALTRLARASERSGDLAQFAAESQGDLGAVVARAREIGLVDQAAILEAFGARRHFDTRGLRAWGPPSAPVVEMAAQATLAEIARRDRGEEGLMALEALVPGGLMGFGPIEDAALVLADELELTGLSGDLVSLLSQASARAQGLPRIERALAQGGLWDATFLPDDQRKALTAELEGLGLAFARGVRIPDRIEWRPSKTTPGIAHGSPLGPPDGRHEDRSSSRSRWQPAPATPNTSMSVSSMSSSFQEAVRSLIDRGGTSAPANIGCRLGASTPQRSRWAYRRHSSSVWPGRGSSSHPLESEPVGPSSRSWSGHRRRTGPGSLRNSLQTARKRAVRPQGPISPVPSSVTWISSHEEGRCND